MSDSELARESAVSQQFPVKARWLCLCKCRLTDSFIENAEISLIILGSSADLNTLPKLELDQLML